MKKIISVIVIAAFLFACNNGKVDETAAVAGDSTAAKAPMVLLGPDDAASVKTSMAALEKGDIDGYVAAYDDNVMFRFSSGDSIVGKAALKEFYTGRWKLIESLKYSNHIYMPLMANESPNGTTSTGKWVLSWVQVDVKYKNGKSLTFWTHSTQHFNDAGKIDQSNQFIDRAPINEATKDMAK